MALFDFLKGIFSERNEEIKKQEKEIVSIDNISSKIEKELLNAENEKLSLRNSIISKIEQFNLEIKDRIIMLETINIDKKKEHEKIKQVVKENLALYIDYLERLAADLDNIKNLTDKDYLKKLEDISNNFNKLSRNAFEKATILIGKELGIARETTDNLFRDLNDIFDKNKDFIGKTNKINEIKSFINELNRIKQHERHITDDIKYLDDKINKINNKIAEIRKEVINLKESFEYKSDLEKKEKRKLDLQKVDREINLIKEKIILKELSKYFHNDAKKSKLIKDYLINFNSALEGDNDLKIIEIVKEANKIDIGELTESREKLIELRNPFIVDSDKKMADFEDEIKKLNLESLNIIGQISQEKKKKEKLIAKKNNAILDIKKNVELIFPDVEVISQRL